MCGNPEKRIICGGYPFAGYIQNNVALTEKAQHPEWRKSTTKHSGTSSPVRSRWSTRPTSFDLFSTLLKVNAYFSRFKTCPSVRQVRVRDRRSVGWDGLRGETCAG